MKDSITPSKPDCKFKKSFMTPCVVTDGEICYSDDGHCVGCGRVKSEITPDATPSKEAKHTAGPKERKWKLLQMPDGGTLADIHGNVIAEIFNHDDAEFIFHAPELAQEVEDLRKELEFETLISDDHLAMKDEALAEIVSLRERIRELAEALTWSSDLFRLLMNNSVDFTDAEKMKISAIAVLSRNESKPSVSGGTNDKEI